MDTPFYLVEIVIYILIAAIPAFLTISNVLNLFLKKRFIPDIIDMALFIVGPLFTVLLYFLWSPSPWQESLINWSDAPNFPFHEPITNYLTVLVLFVVAILGYAVLRVKRAALPPLIIVVCMAAMYMGCALSVAWILQLSPNILRAYDTLPIEGLLMCLFPLNFIISTISVMRWVIKDIGESSAEKQYKSRLLIWSSSVIKKVSSYPLAAFILMWPLFGLITVILILFGQQPDAVVKAFTHTSDWLFSQKISPEPVYMEGHYLCTVAAGGHRRIVKPLRFGVRHGKRIIVNRQLCVANAFEDLIAEKLPRTHRMIRHIYDKYGYPVAKYIRTPVAADVTYLIMKPLEWVFLAVLYLADIKPEDRIARQYLPAK